MLNNDIMRQAGLDDFEIVHAMANLDTQYGPEHVVAADSGRQIRCPAHPAECDYARVTTIVGDQVVEIAYWNTEEFRENPAEILGALLGAVGGKTAVATETADESGMSDVYRTTIQVTVLHQAENATQVTETTTMPLPLIIEEMDRGELLGHAKVVSTRRIPTADLVAEQLAVGGDGTFFEQDDDE